MTVCCENRIQQSHCEYSFLLIPVHVFSCMRSTPRFVSKIKCIHLGIDSVFLSTGSTEARIYRDTRRLSLMSSRQNQPKKGSSKSTGAKSASPNRDQKNGNVPNGNQDSNKLNNQKTSKFLLSSQASNHRHTVHSFICFTNTILSPR